MQGFMAIAEYGGFSAAARHLHLTPPILTKQIQRLEAYVGRPLFERTTRSVLLTEVGRTYLTHVRRITADIEEARAAANNIEREPHGEIRLGVPGIFGFTPFIKMLHGFLAEHPKIVLHTVEAGGYEMFADDKVDILINELDLHDQRLNQEFLVALHRGIYASPAYLAEHGTPAAIADLEQHNCLLYRPISPYGEWRVSASKKVRVYGNYSSNSGQNLICAAVAGMGLIWSPAITLQDRLDAGQLVEVMVTDQPFESPFYIYYPPTRRGSNVQLLVDYLKRSMQEFVANL
ncbi:MAG: hypothetical protein A3J38_03035 [Gammaproteobacteria bacterium RIFCSPHIGHO2_12_FULL_45_9]|nr:MAG: hypothetical protein A3J38_03035 [Gammaproteobacteria bacterium RIFCSPHIGHO2_12_FULL_45_9]